MRRPHHMMPSGNPAPLRQRHQAPRQRARKALNPFLNTGHLSRCRNPGTPCVRQALPLLRDKGFRQLQRPFLRRSGTFSDPRRTSIDRIDQDRRSPDLGPTADACGWNSGLPIPQVSDAPIVPRRRLASRTFRHRSRAGAPTITSPERSITISAVFRSLRIRVNSISWAHIFMAEATPRDVSRPAWSIPRRSADADPEPDSMPETISSVSMFARRRRT